MSRSNPALQQQHMSTSESARLDRIEEKIDRLTDAIVAIARAEEKLSALEKSNTLVIERLMKNEERLVSVEKQTNTVEESTRGIVNLFWTAIGTVVTAAIGSVVFFGHHNSTGG